MKLDNTVLLMKKDYGDSSEVRLHNIQSKEGAQPWIILTLSHKGDHLGKNSLVDVVILEGRHITKEADFKNLHEKLATDTIYHVTIFNGDMIPEGFRADMGIIPPFYPFINNWFDIRATAVVIRPLLLEDLKELNILLA